jgi:hypothetical protein
LYCHNFCRLLLLSNKLDPKHLHPDTRICSPSKSCIGIQKWLRPNLYRDRCAGGFDLNPIPGFDPGRPKHCTAMAPACHQNRTRIGKNCAMLRSLRLWWDNLHSQFAVTASIRLSTTNALYCRAVRLQAGFTARN